MLIEEKAIEEMNSKNDFVPLPFFQISVKKLSDKYFRGYFKKIKEFN